MSNQNFLCRTLCLLLFVLPHVLSKQSPPPLYHHILYIIRSLLSLSFPKAQQTEFLQLRSHRAHAPEPQSTWSYTAGLIQVHPGFSGNEEAKLALQVHSHKYSIERITCHNCLAISLLREYVVNFLLSLWLTHLQFGTTRSLSNVSWYPDST